MRIVRILGLAFAALLFLCCAQAHAQKKDVPGSAKTHPQEEGWQQIWPCEADGAETVRCSGRKPHPSTGPGAYRWFQWGGAGRWKRFRVRKAAPIIIQPSGDCASLRDVAFRLSEFVKGKKVERFVFRGPMCSRKTKAQGEPTYRLVYYVPQSNNLEIACTGGGFYVSIYQRIAKKPKKENKDNLTDQERAKFAALIKKLDDDSWKVREHAQRELEKMGKKILPLIQEEMNNPVVEVRLRVKGILEVLDPAAAFAMGKALSEDYMKEQAAGLVDKLAAYIAARSFRCESEPAKNLALIGPYAVKPLMKHCGSKSANVRAAAVCALGRLGSADSTKAILSLLKTDKDAEVRYQAAAALAKFDSKETRKALKASSEKDASDRVRKQARELLDQIEGKQPGKAKKEKMEK